LRGSHPIEVEVRSALEIDQIFDHISYLKVWSGRQGGVEGG